MRKRPARRFMLVGGSLAICMTGSAFGQTSPINLPAEDLQAALSAFIEQSGVQLIYNPQELHGLKSQDVHDVGDPARALDVLLRGSGLSARHDASGVFYIVRSLDEGRAPPPPPPVLAVRLPEQVIVTGTNIHGVAQVGGDTIVLDRAAIETSGAQTTEQLLDNIPVITGFGNGGYEFRAGSFSITGENLPTIHTLGASNSQSTLILIDGHPLVPSGEDGFTDPAILPMMAIERVDVLPSGDSAIYGSSAISGVINFVTRNDYEGYASSAQYGEAENFNSFAASQLFGHKWATGSMLAAFEYESHATLLAQDRSFSADQDLRRLGGTNFRSYNCSPATISASSSVAAGVFASPYNGSAVALAGDSQGGICDYSGTQGIIPSDDSYTGFVSFNQSLGQRVNIDLDIGYHTRTNAYLGAQSSLSATAFGPTGSSAALGAGSRNPFFAGNAVTGNASEFVRYDFTPLLGPTSTKTGVRAAFANFRADADLGHDWSAQADAVSGQDYAFLHSTNLLCQSCALLALNGTGNTGAAVSSSPVQNLTAGNALDVWNDPAANRTSSSVIGQLESSSGILNVVTTLTEARLKFDGPLFALPAGPVRGAIGGEFSLYDYKSRGNISPSSGQTGTVPIVIAQSRQSSSAFAELFAPIVGPQMQIPLMRQFDLQLAMRYDNYSDFGSTHNPKVGFAWVVDNGLSVRGTYGTSFTAPNISSILPFATGNASANSANFTIPANHPNYPGSFCAAASGPCQVPATMQGVAINSSNPGLQAMTGLSYSFGTDIDAGALAPALQGLSLNATYWQAKFLGGITRPTLQNVLTSPGLQYLLLLAPPGGWTPTSPAVTAALGGLPVISALPSQIFYIYEGIRQNALNIQSNGIDFSTKYTVHLDPWGDFTLGADGSEKLRYDIKAGPRDSPAPYADFLNGHQNASVLKAMQFAGRLSFNAHMGKLDSNIFWNFTNSYWFQNTNPPFNTLGLAPATGAVGSYQKIAANSTIDLQFTYAIGQDGPKLLSGTALTLNVINLADRSPPFYDIGNSGFNASFTGYDIFNGDPVGREIRIGISKKW